MKILMFMKKELKKIQLFKNTKLLPHEKVRKLHLDENTEEDTVQNGINFRIN